MFSSLAFSLLCFCCLTAFADADAVKSVSVTEGDSVTLESGRTELQEEDLITWTFGLSETRIALINKEAEIFNTSDGDAVGFRDRLKLDHQTGSLTITNTRTNDSGLYQVTFNSGQNIRSFRVTVYAPLPVPVIRRNMSQCLSSSSSSSCSVVCSVVNVSHVTLSWLSPGSFSSISVSDLSISLSLPLEVEDQEKNYICVVNNSISNRTTHLNISQTCHTCEVITSTDPPSSSHPPSTSSSHPPSHPSTSPTSPGSALPGSGFDLPLISVAAVAGVLLTVVVVGIVYICRKHRKTDQEENDPKEEGNHVNRGQTRDEEITYADPVFYKRKAEKSEDEVVYAGIVTRR